MLTLEQCGNSLAIWFSVLGTYYMVKGFLSLAPIEILKVMPGNASIVHSLEDIRNVVQQRVESRIGIIFIILSAVVQISILLLNGENKNQPVQIYVLIILICSFIISTIVSHCLCHRYTKVKILETNKLYVKEQINSGIKDSGGLGFNNSIFIKSCAEHYFLMNINEGEHIAQYINRVAKFVGANTPYPNQDEIAI
jgi:hypothetical protein